MDEFTEAVCEEACKSVELYAWLEFADGRRAITSCEVIRAIFLSSSWCACNLLLAELAVYVKVESHFIMVCEGWALVVKLCFLHYDRYIRTGENCFWISNRAGLPAEFKHIIKRRKRN